MKILLTYSGLPNMRISFEENSHQHVYIWALLGTYQEVKAITLLSFFMIFSHQQVYFNYTFNRQTRVGSYKQLAIIEERILEPKTDCSAKDLLFFACVAFCVIAFEPIMI